MLYYETERLILRDWIDSDIEPFIKLNQDPQVMEFFPNYYTKDETIASIERFKKSLTEFGYSLYACELKSNQQFIGFIGLLHRDFDLPFAPCVEIGWRLSKEYWGQGLAVEGAKKCLEIGFGEFNLNEIVSFTAKINHRSERVMQKLCMLYDGGGDFCHPKLPIEHPLNLHILYRISKNRWKQILC